jgi:hypothetical protein
MLHERTVSYGKHNLGSGLGKRPASAAFSRRQYDCLQIYHIPDSVNLFALLIPPLDLFGQVFIKIMNRGEKKKRPNLLYMQRGKITFEDDRTK